MEWSTWPVMYIQMKRKTKTMLFLIDNYFIHMNVRIANDVS